MTQVEVIVASAEEAVDGCAEFWIGSDLVGITVIHDERLHLRVDPRADGEPWLIDTTSLAKALAEATRELAEF
jgi:hypothetical protein